MSKPNPPFHYSPDGVLTAVRCPVSGRIGREWTRHEAAEAGECVVCGLRVARTNKGAVTTHWRCRSAGEAKFDALLKIVQEGRYAER